MNAIRLTAAEPLPCGDCNGNGVLDGCEIGGNALLDVDADGLLDECEGCCNGCDDGDHCTSDRCVSDHCEHVPAPYADVGPCGGDGRIDLADVLTVLEAYARNGVCGCAP